MYWESPGSGGKEAKALQPPAQGIEEPAPPPPGEQAPVATEIRKEDAEPREQVPENLPPDQIADDSPQEFAVEPVEPEKNEAPKTAQVIPIDIQKQKEAQQAVPEKAVAAKAAASEPAVLPDQPQKSASDLVADSSQSVVDRYAAETDLQERDYLEQCVTDITQ